MLRMLGLMVLFCSPLVMAQDQDRMAVIATLNAFHQAAARGDWDQYFDLMADNGVFLGTDAGERWTKQEFEAYARPTDGWTYTPQERNVEISLDGNSAWFDEILLSESYGTSRGTGILLRTTDGWKLVQYHLTFPIPNALAREITDRIKAFEGR